jgi:hypothetical protein
MKALLITLIVAIGALVAATVAPAGATTPAPASITPTRTCASMAGLDVSRVPDAPSRISTAAVVTDKIGTNSIAFCDVKGVIAPRTHFEIKLPVSTWGGRYVQEGCQSYCGSVQRALTDPPLAGYVCKAADDGTLVLAGDDEGHTSADATDGSWAKDDPALRVVFGLTSEHSLAHLAKAVIAGYYGRSPTYSYFDGCSTGGREALMLAQRYPTDFDGIVAGAPASNLAPLGIEAAWLTRSNTDAAGHRILTAEKLPALHAAVMARWPTPPDSSPIPAGAASIPHPCGARQARTTTGASLPRRSAPYAPPTAGPPIGGDGACSTAANPTARSWHGRGSSCNPRTTPRHRVTRCPRNSRSTT